MKTALFLLCTFFASFVFAQTPEIDSLNRGGRHGIDEAPVLLSNLATLLHYPEAAKQSGLEGKVIATVLVGKKGNVLRIDIDRVTDSIFISATKEALTKARFSPSTCKAHPVNVWWTIPIYFTLPKNTTTDADDDIYVFKEPQLIDDVNKYVRIPPNFSGQVFEGDVTLSVWLDKRGKILHVEPEAPADTTIINAATIAIRKGHLTPSILGSKPIPSWLSVPVSFKIIRTTPYRHNR